ncbi:hypothetical protein P3T73_08305 [Kiritimatiellota bacterium B12222]|nr:hypothetical protein P3T73_08305 [Kiritimatiellota bacterium B12222]
MLKLFCVYIFGFSLMSWAQGDELGRYQLILDKQLLGIEKVKAQELPPSKPVIAAPAWSSEYRLTMITQDRRGLRVGIQNLRDQSAYLLMEGDADASEFTLVSGDFSTGSVRIRFRGVEHQFQLEDGQSGRGKLEATPSATTVQERNSLPEVRSRRLRRSRPRPSSLSESKVSAKTSKRE